MPVPRVGGRAAVDQRVLVGLTVVLLVAAALRLAWLDRIPPGWQHDEALMGVMSGEVYRGVERPIFFRQYLGQEPLYIYLAAGAMALLGGDEGVMPFRLLSVSCGLLTVALTFALGRALLGVEVGLIAAALGGANFWQVMSSRQVYRSITQPVLEALAVWLLWRARATKRAGWHALAGAALGGTLYTYLGARAFPGVFVTFGAWLLLTRRPGRADLARAGLLTATALIAVAPLANFFLTNPGTFSARMEQVFVLRPEVNHGQPWAMVWASVTKQLALFTIDGGALWSFNIPGRPIFVGPIALAFYGGLALLIRRLWARDDAAALVLLWILVMAAPSVLSYDAAGYPLRGMGMVPALFFVPAVALAWLRRRAPWPGAPAAASGALLVGLLVAGDAAWTTRDYFHVWARSFGTWWLGNADALYQARFLAREARPEIEELWVGSEFYHHPTLAQHARRVYDKLRWFDGRHSIAFSPDADRPALYVLPFVGRAPDTEELFPASALIEEPRFPEGVDGKPAPPLFSAYRLSASEVDAIVQRLTEREPLRPIGQIAGIVQPIGGRIDADVAPGEEMTADLLWRVLAPPGPGEWQMVAELVDGAFRHQAAHDELGYPPDEWRAGDIVRSRFGLRLPADIQPGRYRVLVALYDRRTVRNWPVVGGVPGIDAVVLGDFRVVGRPPPLPGHLIGARLGEGIELVGADEPPTGERNLAVALTWRADRAVDRDYTVFVHLLSPVGQLVAQSDGQPADGALPTTAWRPGELVRDEHRLALPAGLPPGRYRLIAGMYALPDVTRLPVGGGGDFVELAAVEIGR